MKEGNFRTRLRDTFYIVEANDYERLALWRESAKDADNPVIHEPVNWHQESEGVAVDLGTLDEMPVMVCLTWAIINNIRVMFVDPVGQIVDWRMIDKWLAENCNPQWHDRPARCNAMNFHLCLSAIDERLAYLTSIIEQANTTYGQLAPVCFSKGVRAGGK